MSGRAAVLAVAICGDRIALLRRSLSVLVMATDGTEVGSIDLGISNRDVFAMDLAGDQLLVAFGQSATATNIVGGERTVVRTPEGRVLTAVWTDPAAPPEPPPIGEITRFRVDRERVEADVDDPYLNVRRAPGVQYELVAKLPPAHTGLSRTGLEETADDGALWYEMELLGLGLEESRTLTRGQLTGPDSWTSDLSKFDGYTGPFNSLATIARADFVRVTSGCIPHCAGPPLEWPAPLDGLRQINIEPIGGDSCLQWFAVSLFLDSAGDIEAVVLDLFGS